MIAWQAGFPLGLRSIANASHASARRPNQVEAKLLSSIGHKRLVAALVANVFEKRACVRHAMSVCRLR